jgi:hypothetical protein
MIPLLLKNFNQTTTMSKFSESSAALPPSVCKNSHSIPFISKMKNMDKIDGTDVDKSDWIKLELLMDPDNPA